MTLKLRTDPSGPLPNILPQLQEHHDGRLESDSETHFRFEVSSALQARPQAAYQRV